MKQLVTRGIVLSRTNFGEADRIITVLTPDQGKLRLVTKGVRKIKSRLAGGIELLSVNDLTYIAGRGDMGTLISARLVTNFGNIIKDVDRTMATYDVLKLINKITEDSPEPEYYVLLQKTLFALDDRELLLPVIQLWLHMQLLQLSGHAPNLQSDAEGNQLQVDQTYIFDFTNMSFESQHKGPFEPGHIKMLRMAARANEPQKLQLIFGGEGLVQALEQLTKRMLGIYTKA